MSRLIWYVLFYCDIYIFILVYTKEEALKLIVCISYYVYIMSQKYMFFLLKSACIYIYIYIYIYINALSESVCLEIAVY